MHFGEYFVDLFAPPRNGLFRSIFVSYMEVLRELRRAHEVARSEGRYLTRFIVWFSAPGTLLATAMFCGLIMLDYVSWIADLGKRLVMRLMGYAFLGTSRSFLGCLLFPPLLVLLFPVMLVLLLIPRMSTEVSVEADSSDVVEALFAMGTLGAFAELYRLCPFQMWEYSRNSNVFTALILFPIPWIYAWPLIIVFLILKILYL